MASIRHRTTSSGAERWDVRYEPAPRRGLTGKTFTTLEDAQEFRAAVERALAKGEQAPDPHRRRAAYTVGDWYLNYRDRRMPQLARNTASTYRDMFRFHIAHEDYGIAHRELRELDDDPSVITDWIGAMEAAGVGRPTRAKATAFLSSLLTDAVQRPEIDCCAFDPFPRRPRAAPR